jgi:hypothetical protein
MNDHTECATAARRTGALAAIWLALVLIVASVSSVGLAFSGIDLDLASISSKVPWGANGYPVVFVALVLPFVALASPKGEDDERLHRD